MSTKTVAIHMLVRDELGQVTGSSNATGTTEDEGVTVVIPIGYVPGIESAPPADITLTLIPPPVELPTPESVSRTDDTEASTSTLVFG